MFYLHIGMPKTGTSALQARLAALAGTNPDFLYPSVFREKSLAHHRLAFALESQGTSGEAIKEFIELLKLHSEELVLASSEVFSGYVVPSKIHQLSEFWQMCNQVLPTTFLIVVRRFDRFLDSSYLQTTRVGNFSGSMEKFLLTRHRWTEKFFEGLSELKRVLGANLKIIPYIERFDILAAFEEAVGLQRGRLADGGGGYSRSRLTMKSQALLLCLSQIEEELGFQIERRRLTNALDRGRISFTDDVATYRVISDGDAQSVQVQALAAARRTGASEYIDAFSDITIPQAKFVNLSRELLTNSDMVTIKSFCSHKRTSTGARQT